MARTDRRRTDPGLPERFQRAKGRTVNIYVLASIVIALSVAIGWKIWSQFQPPGA